MGEGSFGLRLTLVATLGGLLFGYDTAVISGAVKSIDADFINPLRLDETWRDTLSGLTISSALFGCVLGGLIAGGVADRWGRKRGLILAALLFLVSALGSAVPEAGLSPIGETGPSALVAFNIYRVLCGVGVGIASMLSPLYIAEIAPKERRGQLVSLNQIAIVSGIVGVYFVNWLIALGGDEAWLDRIGWRLMLGSEAVPALLFFLLLLRVSDTPRWLVLKGRDQEALTLLRRLTPEPAASRTLAEIRDSFTEGHQQARLFAFGSLVILVGFGLSIFQQLVGINAVLYYAPLMFQNLGAGSSSALLQTVVVGVANMLATLIAVLTVDRLGRKPLLIAGAVCMAVPMLALGLLFSLKSQGLLALICVVVYVVGFAMSWGPVVWVLLSEIFPGPIRGKALAIAVAAQWVANLMVSWSFKVLDGNSALNEWLNHGFAYFLYGIMSILAGLFVWRLVPETAGRSLEAINEMWKSPRAAARSTAPDAGALPAGRR
ncbi:MAG TPA: D-xylose transporter XylE [Aliidongia sp.]|nr:D-xylose transporter XylE [Aliidongia sp.]